MCGLGSHEGSTVEKLSARFTKHKADEQTSLTNYINEPSNNSNWNDWYIELYELYPCASKEELKQKEGQIQREIGTVNKRIENRSRKEWYDEVYREIKKDYDKQRYENNIEAKKEENKIWREQNKEKIKEQKKEYYEKNKDILKEKALKYREENKEKKAQYDKEYRKKKKLNAQ